MDSLDFEREWSNTKWEYRVAFARVHCARIGNNSWVKEEHERFHTEMAIFDDHSTWLARPESRKPLSEEDWSQRRKLLASLQDQFLKFISYIQYQDEQMRRSVSQ